MRESCRLADEAGATWRARKPDVALFVLLHAQARLRQRGDTTRASSSENSVEPSHRIRRHPRIVSCRLDTALKAPATGDPSGAQCASGGCRTVSDWRLAVYTPSVDASETKSR